jgi:3'-phosphoadenosine 5'-phosphosulfate sulfotransferase (PAPS reductase)/FAD synthetase
MTSARTAGFALLGQLPFPGTTPAPTPARARRGTTGLPQAPTKRQFLARMLIEQFPTLRYDFAPSADFDTPPVDPLSYDHIIVAFSGGKDSLALVLLLLLLGVPKDRIELWHHEVDGGEGEGPGGRTSTLMDWPCTPAYCAAVAQALGLKLYRSWKIGGFEMEMRKENAPTAGYLFERPDRSFERGGGPSDDGTRRMFPAKVGDLGKRWCSAYLKIMVADIILRNEPRFHGARTLVLTGERGEESSKRDTYKVFQKHRADLRDGRVPRLIDQWRPVLRWPEPEVWKLIERFKINPHPAYHLGWGRVSCAACIFGSPNQWASIQAINPAQFDLIAAYEDDFGHTIDNHRSVREMAALGTPFPGMQARHIRAALSRTYDEPVFVDPWTLPRGALLGDASGPI